MNMSDIGKLLSDYLITFDNLSKDGEKKVEEEKNQWDLNSLIVCEENWKIFITASFESNQLKAHFATKPEEERAKIFKFGVACIICFVRCNFTGPDFDKETEEFLNQEKFTSMTFNKLLSVNNEDININTKFPVLLVTAKYIFEGCSINSMVNNWWYWRSILIHQQILDELSPTLLSDADRLYKHFQVNFNLKGTLKAVHDVEVAQLYLLFRNVSKAKEHILSASEILGVHYNLVGIMGKRTKHQTKDLPQLALNVTVDEKPGIERIEVGELDVPKNIPLNDDVLLNSIEFTTSGDENIANTNLEQKLFVTIVQEMLIAKPQDELQTEELQPFIDLILNQHNTYSVRVVTLLLRCRRTVERSLSQCEEVINSFGRDSPHYLDRMADAFDTGMQPIWKVESQHADLLLNVGLVKNALDVYLKIRLWEEVIVCYTILKMRQKSAEVIQEQLNANPSVKLWCLLGDATDDVACYEKAWELSKKRSHRAQRQWGNYLFTRKQYDECIPHFEKSVSINPLQSSVWFRLGYAALQVENWQTAATAYRRYTCLEPDGFEAWNNLAQAYIKIGNKRNAHQAILEALKCNFDNWKVWENLLVVSCDISNFSDVIRAYHRLLDLKDKYLNVEVLNVLIYNVCNDINDCEGQSSHRFLQKTRELLGRVTAIYPGEGYVWELYANLAPAMLLRAQRLQRAYRGYTQSGWDKNPATCQQVLYVCVKLAEIVLENEISAKDTLINSIRLNLSSAVAAIKKQDWEETRELVDQVSAQLEKIIEKIKSDGSKTNST
ncbi:hypothetical protein NQ317_002589 [Molorchus minor]|uniref:Tetratricopeptide repeat protein 27 n=1 Tax=Molorchus minor TaxID=1323400 RepID=A0ABQ9JVU6_9CUCU|nr:hypothetical protein NQ317_002589 [Molorchus minor]